MDVSHTDHSHIIGKGGGNIKRGMLQVYFNNIDINTQYSIVQKEMQAKCGNFILSRKSSCKSSNVTSQCYERIFAGTKSDISKNFRCLSDNSSYFASQDAKFH